MSTGVPAGRWIRRLGPDRSAPACVVCFPHAGGTASFYAPLARLLVGSVQVLAVQYPGRQDRWREPCAESIEEMADAAAEALYPWTDRPLALFGHSMGAGVAFEVALRLERSGTVACGLYASGRRAPSLPRRHQRSHPDGADDAQLLAELNGLAGSDHRVLDDDNVRSLILPAVRADYRAAGQYRYQGQQQLHAPVVVLAGDEDPMVSPAEARAWAGHTTAATRHHRFPGGHFYLASDMGELAALLRADLAPLTDVRGAAR